MSCNIKLKNLSFQKVIWGCFILFFLASVMVIIFITYEFEETSLRQQLLDKSSGSVSSSASNTDLQDHVLEFFRNLKHRIFWALGILFLGTAVLFLLTVRTITNRLEKVIQGTRKISLGQLAVFIPVQPHDEIGKIGEMINDIAANFQEIFLSLWNHTESCMYTLEQLRNHFQMSPKVPDNLKDTLEHLDTDLEGMQTIIKSFEFYDICIENGKIMALEKTEKGPSIAVNK